MIARAIRILRSRGIAGLAFAINSRVRGLLAGQAKSFRVHENLFAGKSGLEIGGPSRVFSARGVFPVYPIVGNLDNCTFGNVTVWEGDIKPGRTFRFDRNKPAGLQHIADGTDMARFSATTFDFVLASHVLEHVANPILALSEWKRLLKDGGTLVLILPDKRHTFDHRRPVTTLEHLIEDSKSGMTEDDLTHLPEILALHDLERDPEAGNIETFRLRSEHNFENRCLHHHVFDTRLAVNLVEHLGLAVLAADEIRPHHILVLAQKPQAVAHSNDVQR